MKCNAVASIHYDCLYEIRNLDTTARRLPTFLEKNFFTFTSKGDSFCPLCTCSVGEKSWRIILS